MLNWSVTWRNIFIRLRNGGFFLPLDREIGPVVEVAQVRSIRAWINNDVYNIAGEVLPAADKVVFQSPRHLQNCEVKNGV